MVLYNVVFLGDGGVGKSALIIQFVKNLFCTEYDATIENSYRKQITVEDQTDMLDILDTAGQEDYAAMRDQYIRTSEAFVLVYSVCSRSSFEQCRQLFKHIRYLKDEEGAPVLVVLVGNKIDLTAGRVVSSQEGAELAAQLGPQVRFVETSARTRAGIDELFTQLIRLLRAARADKLTNGRGKDQAGNNTRPASGGGCTLL